jgi:hypothetical protein
MNTSCREPHLLRSLSILVCALFVTAVLSACRMTNNRPIVGHGPGFDQSFEAVLVAMKTRGYTVAKTDSALGEIETEKRKENDWWWMIDAVVARDGTVVFTVSGSDRVQKGDKIHKRLLSFAEELMHTFQEKVAAAQPIPH